MGWGEFRDDGEHREENRVENTVWQGEKNIEDENSGEKFISWAHKFLWEEKLGGKSALNSLGECVE